MPFIDFAILLLVIWAAYKGWRQGFFKELISAIGFIVGLFVAATLYSQFGEYLAPHLGAPLTAAKIIAFVVLWIVVPIVLGMVANLLTKALKGMKIGLPNSILGSAMSLMKYLVLMSCVFNVMSALGIVSQEKASASFFYEPIKDSLGKAFKAYSEHHQDDADSQKSDSTNTDDDEDEDEDEESDDSADFRQV